MARHYGMTIEPMHSALSVRKQISARLISAHARIGDDHRRPSVEAPRGYLNGVPDRTNVRRRVECRADLVVNDLRAR
jgi:hypothetical protein